MRRFDEIQTFVQVIEAGGISKAAQRLGISKSSASKRIADLEDALGTQLLYRSSRRVFPTEGGLLFYERARGILHQLDEAVEELTERPDDLSGTVRITAPMSFGNLYLGSLLLPLLVRHPRLELSIDLDDRFVDIQDAGYDLAIRIGRLADSALVARRLATIERVVCCSPKYAERHGTPKTVAELADHEWLGYTNIQGTELWQFDQGDAPAPVRLPFAKSRFVTNNGELIRQAAILGLGIAVLPGFIVCHAIASGELMPLQLDARPTPGAVHAVYPPSRNLSRKVRAIIEHLANELRDGTPWDLDEAEARKTCEDGRAAKPRPKRASRR